MKQVGVRALQQNASAVVADAASGEVVVITDRGRPVAQLVPLSTDRLDALVTAGRARRARKPLAELPPPARRKPGRAALSAALEEMRVLERF